PNCVFQDASANCRVDEYHALGNTMTSNPELSKEQQAGNADLEQLVADVDRGGRTVGGVTGTVLFLGALFWSLFQLWYASPLPFTLNFGIFNDTEARALHLGIAMFLGYLAYPARKRSPRDVMPIHVWVLALIAAFCGSYLFIFYGVMATRPGMPTTMDITCAAI